MTARRLLAAVLALGSIPAGAVRAQEGPARLTYTINDDWRYAPGPIPGAHAPDLEDGEWERVRLPHTWNADAVASADGTYRRGVGWYRKHLTLEPGLEGKRLFLRFEGANQVAEVFVNGQRAGGHVGGYTAVAVDITDLVRPGGPNLVAVRVDNAHDPDIPPLNADFTFYGGIYRDVWLIATSPLHITLLDHGSSGVFVDTPERTADQARVRVRGTVVNATGRARAVEVVSRVVDADGLDVATLRSTLEIPGCCSPRWRAGSPASGS